MATEQFVNLHGHTMSLTLESLVQRMADRLISLEAEQATDAVLVFHEGKSGVEVQLGPCDSWPRYIALSPTMEGATWASYAYLRDQLAVGEESKPASWLECY